MQYYTYNFLQFTRFRLNYIYLNKIIYVRFFNKHFFIMAAIPNVAVPSSQKKPAKKREIQFTDEMDEILKRITEIKNVAGVVVVNSEGITVKSTLDNVLSVQVIN